MARRATTIPIPRLLTKAAACEYLGIGPVSFWRHWQEVFTDRRPAGVRGPGTDRLVYEDELAEAVAHGGGVNPRAKAAVLRYRGLLKRT